MENNEKLAVCAKEENRFDKSEALAAICDAAVRAAIAAIGGIFEAVGKACVEQATKK